MLVYGIPVDFILFALILLGVALFHRHTLPVALGGLAAIIAYKLAFTGFKYGPGVDGLGEHMAHECVTLANLFLLLMGFALLSRHFEDSRIPDEMPAVLPDDWKGGVTLLAMVFVLSGVGLALFEVWWHTTMAQRIPPHALSRVSSYDWMGSLALLGLTSFTTLPLRVWSVVGGIISLAALLYGLWITMETLIFGNPLDGWPTLAASIMLFSGVQLMSIGILGEYIGRIYDEVKRRPTYLLARDEDRSPLAPRD